MRALIEEGLTHAERAFNILGCVPVAAIFSGAIRTIVGKVQFIVGAVFVVLGAINYFAYSRSYCVEVGVEHMIHGTLNFGRGLAELLLGITIVGTVIPLFCQLITDPTFQPRFPYTTQRRFYAL